MADKYIDLDETQIYGPHAAKQIAARVVGLIPACDGALQYFADAIKERTSAIGKAVQSSREAAAGVRKGASDKRPKLVEALDLLNRFSSHLDAHRKGAVDRKVFFPEDGTVRGIGRSATRLLLALDRVRTELGKSGSPVKGASEWKADFDAAHEGLSPAVEKSHEARAHQAEATPDTEALRDAWLLTYGAAKDVVEGVLREKGKSNLLKVVFYDLAVSDDAKVTSIPESAGLDNVASATAPAASSATNPTK